MTLESAASLPGVTALGAIAALTAGLGPTVFRRQRAPRAQVVGYADALAAGMMLGLGYALMALGVARGATVATIGAAVGVAAMSWLHARLDIDDSAPAKRPSLAFVAAAVHAIPEGVALGAAAAVSGSVGIAVAAMLALHNISESAVLTSRSDEPHTPLRDAAIAIASNLPQIAFGVLAFLVARWLPVTHSPLLGASFGALMYLCFAELLPESYRLAGRSGIAVVVTIAAGIVALVSGAA